MLAARSFGLLWLLFYIVDCRVKLGIDPLREHGATKHYLTLRDHAMILPYRAVEGSFLDDRTNRSRISWLAAMGA